jgi:hypothetical protein
MPNTLTAPSPRARADRDAALLTAYNAGALAACTGAPCPHAEGTPEFDAYHAGWGDALRARTVPAAALRRTARLA